MTHELIANAEEEKLTMDGKAVQKAFLPLVDSGVNNKETFAEFNDETLECFGYYEGESGVSGDYFDYKILDDTWFCVIKCDAAGHGIPAAIIMTVVATIFRRFFDKWTYKKDGVNLSILVEQINDFIEGLGLKGKFATLIICLLNRKNGELYMCNAGDNLVHIFDSKTKKMKLLKLSSSPTAGIFTSELVAMKGGFIVEKTVLNHQDILFLYTDGEQSIIYVINNMGELVSTQVDTIDGYVLTERTITADKIVAHSITAAEIAAKTITANEILAGTITGNEIAGETITGANIKAGTLTTSHVTADFGKTLDLTSNTGINQRVQKVYTDMDALLGYRLEVASSSDILSDSIQSTVLTARVWHGSQNVTDTLDASRFRWKRVSSDPTADELWNAAHAGMKAVTLTVRDVLYSATYSCELTDKED